MTRRTRLGRVTAALAFAGLAAGCGTKFELPTEHRENRVIPGNGTYQMIKTRHGLTGIQDILLAPSGELFLLFQNQVAKTGKVEEWSPTLGDPLSSPFPGLHNPTALCFGANKVFVLDQGDTAAARTTRDSTDYTIECGGIDGFARPIAHLGQYWCVREFELDGTPVGSTPGPSSPFPHKSFAFTDTSYIWVNGIAADAQQRVYVSGIFMNCFVNPFDTRIHTLQPRYRVRRYVRGVGSGSVIGNWQPDPSWEVGEGNGVGFAIDPRGMQWSGVGGEALYFADRGNNEVQKFADPASYGSSFKLHLDLPLCDLDFAVDSDSTTFQSPVDVSVDAYGFVYCVDGGNHRVLRYAPEGCFYQRVDIAGDDVPRPLAEPVAVAADTEQVYVADRMFSEVVRYRRRK